VPKSAGLACAWSIMIANFRQPRYEVVMVTKMCVRLAVGLRGLSLSCRFSRARCCEGCKERRVELFQSDSSVQDSHCRDETMFVVLKAGKFMGKRFGRPIWQSGGSPG
jgi:hypothetical protein